MIIDSSGFEGNTSIGTENKKEITVPMSAAELVDRVSIVNGSGGVYEENNIQGRNPYDLKGNIREDGRGNYESLSGEYRSDSARPRYSSDELSSRRVSDVLNRLGYDLHDSGNKYREKEEAL